MGIQTPYFSVIMPAYNAEAYLQETVESLLRQSFQDFELLIINDCSKDSTASVCTALAQKNSRIIPLATPHNMGAAGTRNLGLDYATGQYICFVDADDRTEPDLLETIYKVLSTNEYDCLKFGLVEEYYGKDQQIVYRKTCTLNNDEYHKGRALNNQIVDMEAIPLFGYLWNGVYKNSIIKEHHLRLDETLPVNEDFAFNFQFFHYVNVLKCLDYVGYHYAKRVNQSLSNQGKQYSYDIYMMKIRDLLGLYNEEIPEERKTKIFWMYVRFVYAYLLNQSGEKFDSVLKQVKSDRLYEQFLTVPFNHVNSKQKVAISLLKSKTDFGLQAIVKGILWLKKTNPSLFARVKR